MSAQHMCYSCRTIWRRGSGPRFDDIEICPACGDIGPHETPPDADTDRDQIDRLFLGEGDD